MNFVSNSILERIVKELEFYHSFKNRPREEFGIHHSGDDNFLEHIFNYIEGHERGLINYGNEVLPDDYYQLVIDKIKKTGHNILIKSSNALESPYGFHPLTNIAIWQRHTMPEENIYIEDTDIHNYFTPFSPWDDTRNIKTTDKSNRYILSVRRTTPIRDKLFNIINQNSRKWDCIVRYSKYDDELQIAKYKKKTSEIMDEYKKTYISFVVETIYDGMYNDKSNYSINLTEKTLFAFKSKTLPIFFGCKHLVKSIKKMGFYTFDDLFNLNIDEIDTFDEIRLDKYVKCLEEVDSMTESEVIKLYEKNFDKIEFNYNFLNYLFELNQSIEHKHDTLARFTKDSNPIFYLDN